uniref:Uncharacterized protein n=1 Tax=Panagrolaimus davidi TaxID=227884 RepID=A0A914PD20_9BILA
MISEEKIVTTINPPKFKGFLLVVNIDNNGIYEITFEKVPINPIIGVDNYIQAVYFETQNDNISKNDFTLVKEFKLPKAIHDGHNRIVTNDKCYNVAGIHSGNWKTSAAICKNNEIKNISLGENEDDVIIASYVHFDDENVKCGLIDFEGIQYPSSSVYDIKTIIGKNLNEITIDKSWLFQLTETQNVDEFVEAMQEKLGINFKTGILLENFCGPIIKCPEEIYAFLLKHVKTKAKEQHQKLKLTDAIITVPGNYSENQKTTTRIAALLAGWQNIFFNSRINCNNVCKFFGSFRF